MFGYLDINREQMSEEALGRWKAYYCGLCRALQERRGALGRLTLSNDMTFLTVLLSSLYEPRERTGRSGCPVHPLRPRDYVRTEMTEYAADMNLLLSYYHCLDNERDEGSRAQGLMARRLQPAVKEAEKAWPRQVEAVRESIERISALEKESSPSVDALLDLSGRMLGPLFAPREDAFAPSRPFI